MGWGGADMEFHLRKGKAILDLERALPFENLKVRWKHLKGHKIRPVATGAGVNSRLGGGVGTQ